MAGNGLEIERKYLLSRAPSRAELGALGARATRIEQVYLRMTDDWVRRVRRVETDGRERYVLTRKRDVEGIVRRELESEITSAEYARLLGDADPARRPIRKIRHVIAAGRWTLEVDVFSQPPGLVLLEVELEGADEVPVLPAAIGGLVVREVSEDPAYANYNLALSPEAADAAVGGGSPLATMAADGPDDRPDELSPAESARARRRDRDAAAAERKGMRTGLAKQFKQVLDAQAKRGREAGAPRSSPSAPRVPDDADRPDSRQPKKHRSRNGEP